jgi:hypothetical protein
MGIAINALTHGQTSETSSGSEVNGYVACLGQPGYDLFCLITQYDILFAISSTYFFRLPFRIVLALR